MNISSECNFERKAYSSMSVYKYGKFRDSGKIHIDKDTIKIDGNRVYAFSFRIFIASLLVLLPLVFIHKLNYIFFLVIVIFVIYLLLSEELFMKKEIIKINWDQIEKYELDYKNKRIAFSIMDNPSYSPIVFSSSRFDKFASSFRQNIPDRERTSKGLKGMEQRNADQVNAMAKFLDRFIKNF